MSSISRLILLAMFAAVGAGAAICLALSDPAPPVAGAKSGPVSQPHESAVQPAQIPAAAIPVAGVTQSPALSVPPQTAPPQHPASSAAEQAAALADAGCRYFIARPSPLVEVHAWSPATRLE